MSDEASAARSGLSSALQKLKEVALFTTPGDDVDQAQSAAFAHALTAFETGADPITMSEDEQSCYNLLEHLSAILKFLNTALEEEGAVLSGDVQGLLQFRSDEVGKEAEPFESPASGLVRTIWGIGNGLLIAWDATIAGVGPEPAHAPRAIVSDFRSICLFIQYLMSPTANSRQLFDMSVQRTIQILPGMIAYTIGIAIESVYGTPGYDASSITTSLALLAAIVLPGDIRNVRDNRQLKKHLERLMTLTPSDIEQGGELRDLQDKLQLTIEELIEVQGLIRDTAARFHQGHATSAQTTVLDTAMQSLTTGLEVVTKEKFPDQPEDPDRKKKLSVLGLGVGLVGVTFASSVKNPMLLVSSLQWGTYYLYRLAKSAWNAVAKVRNTLELFCNAGAVMVIATPLFLCPLLADKHFFNTHPNLLKIFSSMLVAYNTLFVHHIGPSALKFFDYIGGSKTGEPLDIAAFMDRLQSQMEISEGSISTVFSDILSELTSAEQKIRTEHGTSESAFPDDHETNASMLEGEANLVDLFSVLDIQESFEALKASSSGYEGFIKAFKTGISNGARHDQAEVDAAGNVVELTIGQQAFTRGAPVADLVAAWFAGELEEKLFTFWRV
jgi:hypothetical protein